MSISDALKKVVVGVNLTAVEAESVLEEIIEGGATDAQIAALLTALRMKGESIEEIAGFARAMRGKATRVPTGSQVAADFAGTGRDSLLDTCGTGGDVSGTFNVSTATALVVAGAGARVAKHGNRSVSSRCGSADVIEALGIPIDLGPEQVAACIDNVGIGFIFAQAFHKATGHVAAIRRQLGFRTVFNLLGPLTNPAGARTQLVGVYAPQLTETICRALMMLGAERVLAVHGSDGLDEITIAGETRVTELEGGRLRTYTIAPQDFGIRRATLADIQGGDAEENAAIILDILSGGLGPKRDVVLLNAAAALVACGRAVDFKAGLKQAEDSIDSRRAKEKLQRLVTFSRSLKD